MRTSRWIRVGLVVITLGLVAPAATRADTPDAWITTKAKIALLTTKDVSATAIKVDTVNGRVTLHGKVGSADEKQKAEETVRQISGVKEVRNLLQAVPAGRRETVKASDVELKKRVEKALKDDRTLAESSISVQSVNSGVVLLAGRAKTMSDHLRAIEDASAIPGVRRVSSEVQSPDSLADDQIRHEESSTARAGKAAKETAEGVGAAASDMYITSAAKMRLLADSRTPALDVNVDTSRGVVTLFGMVPSTEAKAAAEDDARKVSGVKRVVNELQVVPSSKQASVKAKDEDIEREVKKAIDAREFTNASISVDVKNGVARLTGTVPSEQDRLSAAIAARSAPGVRSVEDDLRISAR